MKFSSPNGSIIYSDNKQLLVEVAVNVFSCIYIRKEMKITERETDCFVGCVLAYHEGIDLWSKRFMTFMRKTIVYAPSKNYLSTLRGRLVAKGWLIQTQDSFDIPDIFKQNIEELILDLKLKVRNGTPIGSQNT